MKFKPWQETLSSSRSLFKVLPSSLSPPGPKGYCWVGVAQWRCSIRVALLFRQCSSCTRQQLQAGVAKAPGSCPTLLQREAQPPQQLIHTKKRAWPFLFNLRIFPRRCLAVAIPFFGRLPTKHNTMVSNNAKHTLQTAPERFRKEACAAHCISKPHFWSATV